MYQIETTEKFDKWLKKLRDRQAVTAIVQRLAIIEADGYFGDCKQLSNHLWELRFFIGKGYRIYFTKRGDTLILLLSGGDKSNKKAQDEMIKIAQQMVDTLNEKQ